MGFLLLLVYLVLTYIRLPELEPDLARWRIMLWLGTMGLAVSVVPALLRRQVLRTPQLYWMLGFLASLALSRAVQGWLGGAWRAIADFGSVAAAFFLILFNVTTLKRLRVLVGVLVLLSLAIAAQGILAYHAGHMADRLILSRPLEPAGAFEADDPAAGRPLLSRIRAMGVLADPNDLAQALIAVLPFLALAWRSGRPLYSLLVVGLPAGLLLYAIYLTRSRGAVVGLGVTVLLAVGHRAGLLKAAPLAAVAIVALVTAGITGGRPLSLLEASAAGRWEAWSAGLAMLKQNPLFGVGFHAFTDYHERASHNSFVNCFAELGLVGYFFWLGLLYITLRELFTLVRQGRDGEGASAFHRWAVATLVAIAAYLACGWFLSRTYTITLYLLVALAAVVLQRAREHGVFAPPLAWPRMLASVAALQAASVAVVYLWARTYWLLRA
jgi:hypothetical protein